MRQEELIAQKKREIEAKLAEQAKRNVSAPSKPSAERLHNYTHSSISVKSLHLILVWNSNCLLLLSFQYPWFTGTDLEQVCKRRELSSAVSKDAEGEIRPRFRFNIFSFSYLTITSVDTSLGVFYRRQLRQNPLLAMSPWDFGKSQRVTAVTTIQHLWYRL